MCCFNKLFACFTRYDWSNNSKHCAFSIYHLQRVELHKCNFALPSFLSLIIFWPTTLKSKVTISLQLNPFCTSGRPCFASLFCFKYANLLTFMTKSHQVSVPITLTGTNKSIATFNALRSHAVAALLIWNQIAGCHASCLMNRSTTFADPFQNWAYWKLGRVPAQIADLTYPFKIMQLFGSFTKYCMSDPRAFHGSESRSTTSFSKASNPLGILYKNEHLGASGTPWRTRPICYMIFKCLKFFRNPFTKFIILEAQAPVGPNGPSYISFQHGSNSLQVGWLTGQLKSCTNLSQNGAFWSLELLAAQIEQTLSGLPAVCKLAICCKELWASL